MQLVFRDHQSQIQFLDYYASNMDISFALHTELMRAILAIEIVFDKI
jgi:hypothetical protein